MTSQRYALFPVALLDAAFSLAFWLSDRITFASSAAATEPARATPPHSPPTVRPFGLDPAGDQLGRPPRADRVPVAPAAHGSCPSSLPPLTSGACRSSSPRSQQIPLLVRGLKPRLSALQNGTFPTHLERLGRGSLNPSLSLRGGVA
jgi:hypothetical protein